MLLLRTGAVQEIDLAVTVTPLGAISRLEHALAGIEDERDACRHRLDDACRRLVSYRSRQGGAFAFADDLAEKRRRLCEVEVALAADAYGESDAVQQSELCAAECEIVCTAANA